MFHAQAKLIQRKAAVCWSVSVVGSTGSLSCSIFYDSQLRSQLIAVISLASVQQGWISSVGLLGLEFGKCDDFRL